MALGQYDGLGECCGPSTASYVFLILICVFLQCVGLVWLISYLIDILFLQVNGVGRFFFIEN